MSMSVSNPLAQVIATLAATKSASKRAALNRDLAHDIAALPDSATLLLDYLVNCTAAAQRQAALTLITTVLDEARMAAENRQAKGLDCVADFAGTLEQLDQAGRLSEEDRFQLLQAYARARLDPPGALALIEMESGFAVPARGGFLSGLPGSDAADMDASIDLLLKDLKGPALGLHDQLGEMLATLPPPMRAFTISRILTRTGEPVDSFAAYWLLDPVAEVRRATAHALLERARNGKLPPTLKARLAHLLPWLTDERERAAVAQILAQTQLHMVSTPAVTVSWHIAKMSMSLPDGAGCQSIAVLLEPQKRGKARPQVVMLMLKAGQGIKDCFIIPDAAPRTITQLMTGMGGEMPMMVVSPQALAPLLQMGLRDGFDNGALPAPGFVDVAQALPELDLTPQSLHLEALMTLLDKAGSLRKLSASAGQKLMQDLLPLLNQTPTLDSWFEEDVSLDAALQTARSNKAIDSAIFNHLTARRDWWMQQCAQTALTLHHAPKRNAPLICLLTLSMLALADTKIKVATLPLMQQIAANSMEAYLSRHDAPMQRAPAPPPQKLSKTAGKRLLADILKRSGLSEAWLEGFCIACAITPLTTTPEKLINALLGKLRLGSFEDIQQTVELLVDQLNSNFTLVRNEAKLRKYIKALSQDSSKAWCTGFALHMKTAKRSWTKRPQTANDKTLLKAIDAGQNTGLDETIRSALPLWIASRLGGTAQSHET